MRAESVYSAKVFMDNHKKNLSTVEDVHKLFKEDEPQIKSLLAASFRKQGGTPQYWASVKDKLRQGMT